MNKFKFDVFLIKNKINNLYVQIHIYAMKSLNFPLRLVKFFRKKKRAFFVFFLLSV